LLLPDPSHRTTPPRVSINVIIDIARTLGKRRRIWRHLWRRTDGWATNIHHSALRLRTRRNWQYLSIICGYYQSA